MLFMVIEHFKDVSAIGARFRAKGRMLPEGVTYQTSWIDAAQLPAVVRVTVRNAVTARVLSVSTAALIHVTASAECVRAKGTRNCVNPVSGESENSGAPPGGGQRL